MNIFWRPTYQPELYHHGVKGMRWGIRKDRKSSSKKRKTALEKETIDKYRKDVFGSSGHAYYDRKVKASNGKEYYMIFSDDGDPTTLPSKLKTVERLKKNPDVVDKACFPLVENSYLSYAKEWTGREVSKQEFRKNMKLESFYIYRDGGIEASYYDDGKYFGGHTIDVEYDPKTKKALTSSMNG